jgi:hypothetical protein
LKYTPPEVAIRSHLCRSLEARAQYLVQVPINPAPTATIADSRAN